MLKKYIYDNETQKNIKARKVIWRWKIKIIH